MPANLHHHQPFRKDETYNEQVGEMVAQEGGRQALEPPGPRDPPSQHRGYRVDQREQQGDQEQHEDRCVPADEELSQRVQ